MFLEAERSDEFITGSCILAFLGSLASSQVLSVRIADCGEAIYKFSFALLLKLLLDVMCQLPTVRLNDV